MIKIENIETCGWEAAIRGMRNPMNSWHMNDSFRDDNGVFILGHNDLKLVKGLTKAGNSHRKMLRMIHIQADVTAPLYWWKDYDTYKVATTANGCSTMHKIHEKEFTRKDFAHEHLDYVGLAVLDITIDALNLNRDKFLTSNKTDMSAWHNMIQLLPTSYLQKRTIDINYETAYSIILDRQAHKLYEFRDLCIMLLNELPYMHEIINAGVESKKSI